MLEIAYKPQPLSIQLEIEISIINESTEKIEVTSHTRRVTNIGIRDALIKVQGGNSSPVWHRVNPGEIFYGLVDLQTIRCLNTQSAKRTPAQIAAALVASSVDSLWERVITELSNFSGEYGAAQACSNQGYGNAYSGSIGKFKNFTPTASFSHMNNYLAMQAANKTYYQQFNFNGRYPTTESQYRCAATEQYKHWGFNEVYFVNSIAGGNLIIAEMNDWVLISVRGTQMFIDATEGNNDNALINSITDLLANGPSAPLPAMTLITGAKGRVHSGYMAVVTSLMPLIGNTLKDMNAKNKKIFVTGHSLGAATATVLAYKMKHEGYKIQAAYTYASPKIGDAELMDDIDDNLNVYSVINYRDPVPDYPTLTNHLSFSPQHYSADVLIYLNKNHTPREYNSSNTDLEKYLNIREDQGNPLPLTFSASELAREWHFHNGNFYVAFLYNYFKDRTVDLVSGTDIKPDYQKQVWCLDGKSNRRKSQINWHDGTYNYTQWFLNDSNGYPVQECDGEPKDEPIINTIPVEMPSRKPIQIRRRNAIQIQGGIRQ
ncbi:lipase family protein [Paraglaciecola sp. L3A3]|uniref:lipase family protein n=1 Tax=Paraglaciecola sp. L3A3 TaxID=2686358 RepID=UPI00131CE302|nr:lipase family protein [Paraglaciecola sp. L3A3]